MKIAIVGCGFVSDYYLSTLKNYPGLELTKVFDKLPERARDVAERESVQATASLQEILTDQDIEMVLNLTNPRDHFEVSKQCLEAGKHVYSEKPFAMELEQCQELYDLAKAKGLLIASAPCSILGESAQTMWQAIEDAKIGDVRLVYAEMDDGPIYHMSPETWTSQSGLPWPVKDEYEIGCTLEHIGYCLNWLIGMFGGVESVHAFSECVMKDKGVDNLDPADTPDFSVATLKFHSGVVARITCSIVAPHNHEMSIIGDKGVLKVDESWHYSSPVLLQKASLTAHKAERYAWIRKSKILSWIFGLSFKKLPFKGTPNQKMKYKKDYMDYARGVNELKDAIRGSKNQILTPEFCLHVNEVALAVHYSYKSPGTYQMTTKYSSQKETLKKSPSLLTD